MAKEQCMCCRSQRQGIPKPAASGSGSAGVRTNDVLMQPQLSRTTSFRKVESFGLPSPVKRRSRNVQSIRPGEVARRAVRSCRSIGAHKLRRRNFESKPSRLSKVSTADDH